MEKFNRFLQKKVKSGSSGEPVDEQAPHWRYFDRMNFLKAFIGSKKYVTNSITMRQQNYRLINSCTCRSILC